MRSKIVEAKIAVAFAAVIAAFIGAVAYVPLALVPSTRRAELIQHRYTEAVNRGDETLVKLLDADAAEARREAEQIHAELQRVSEVYLVLAALGTLGAVVLLLECICLLRRYGRSAEKRQAELEAFAAQVAHDLRGPLQTIQLTVHLIEKASESAYVKRLAGSATGGVQRLVAMIGDLLQFARSGGDVSKHAVTNVASVVSQTCEEVLPRAAEAHVKVNSNSDPLAQARVAPVALRTILANLLENAVKYSGEQQNVVDVCATCNGDDVQLVVKDRGTGIPREILPHLFEPFVHGTQRRDSYGLGLATVKRLVDAHGGTIAVQSEEGCGTTFVVRLPAARMSALPGPGAEISRLT